MKTFKALITPTVSGGNIEVTIYANSAKQAQELIKTLPYYKRFVKMPFVVNEADGRLEELIAKANKY